MLDVFCSCCVLLYLGDVSMMRGNNASLYIIILGTPCSSHLCMQFMCSALKMQITTFQPPCSDLDFATSHSDNTFSKFSILLVSILSK